MAGIVSLSRVCKRFDQRVAVADLDLDIPRGCCFGLLGPNGAGKTTTLRMVYGVTKPTSGSIRVFDMDIATNRREIRGRLGVTLQDNVLIEPLTAEENLRVFGRYYLLEENVLTRRIDQMVEFLELGTHRDVPVRNLSGGYQRRVAIAMALIADPELLILDEPTTGLDPAVRRALWARVSDLRRQGTTILLTTHYMDEAQRLCDEVVIMSGGRAIAHGNPDALINQTLSEQTVELDCSLEEEARLFADLATPAHRSRSGERLIMHTTDGAALVAHARERDQRKDRRFVARPTNLEDVYLELTGSSLEGEE